MKHETLLVIGWPVKRKDDLGKTMSFYSPGSELGGFGRLLPMQCPSRRTNKNDLQKLPTI